MKKVFKRIFSVSVVLLLTLVLTTGATGVSAEVSFVDMETPDSRSTTIIEGNSVNIQVDLPADFLADSPPFAAYQDGRALADGTLLDFTPVGAEGSNRYQLNALPGAALGIDGVAGDKDSDGNTIPTLTDREQPAYSISPRFRAHLTDGSVREEYGSPAIARTTTVTSDNALVITEHSTIKLRVVGNETVQGDIQLEIVEATGNFLPYNTGATATLQGDTLSTGRVMTVAINKADQPPLAFDYRTAQPFQLNIEGIDGNNRGILGGTIF